MIINKSSNQIILITFFKENTPSSSIIRSIKNKIRAYYLSFNEEILG
jgi:hypothetical protein